MKEIFHLMNKNQKKLMTLIFLYTILYHAKLLKNWIAKKINRREKNKLQEEQLRTDQETFGYNNTYDNRQRTNNYSNNYSNNYQSNYQNNYPKKRYHNTSEGNQYSRPINTRNQYPQRQGYTIRQNHQGKKFRPKEQTEST